MNDRQGPRVFATRENTADSGGGRLELRAGRLGVSGRVRSRDLGAASELTAIVFTDRSNAELRFANGAAWNVRAEEAGLLPFAHELAATLGRAELVQAPVPVAPETLRQIAVVVIALALAAAAVLGTILVRDRLGQSEREEAARRQAESLQADIERRDADEQARAAAQAKALASDLRAALEAKRWKDAEANHAALAGLVPTHPSLAPAMAVLRPELERLREEERVGAVAAGIIDGRSALVDPVRCDDAHHVAQAWRGLRQARPGDADWEAAKAVAGALERCRLLVVKATTRNVRELRDGQLRRFALELPDRLRRDRHAAVVRTSGKDGRELVVEIAGIEREGAERISKTEVAEGTSLLAEAERVGVSKLTITDGDARFPFPLVPAEDDASVAPILATLGLDLPFSLAEPPR